MRNILNKGETKMKATNQVTKEITMESPEVVKILTLYYAGHYGTIENPIRTSGPKQAFWSVVLGHRKAREWYGTNVESAARAGQLVRSQPKGE